VVPGTPPLTSGVVSTDFQRAGVVAKPVTFAPTGSALVCASSMAMVIFCLAGAGELGQVFLHGRVEVDLALVDELQVSIAV
jgi:hypothetical protein